MDLEKVRQEEFIKFMDQARADLLATITEKAKEALSTVYTDYAQYIESDAWLNYREELKNELAGKTYKEVTTSESLWAKDVRTKIFQENQRDLLPKLNQDLLKQIDELKQELKRSYNRGY